eukprot:m.46758 g.46758  ORF g.46758 m.46758 type:complete len:541 (+) comp17555_c0_seq2:89-1711(+)
MKALLLIFATAACLFLTSAKPCSDIKTCAGISTNTTCGWCWYATTTQGEKHGSRPGTTKGPTDGSSCHDWTFNGTECHHHVDCNSLPDCLNILGTYCGWCADTNKGMRGTASGPSTGSCNKWVWSHADCPKQQGPQQIHLAYGVNTTSIVITWATEGDSSGSATISPMGGSSGESTTASKDYFGLPYNVDGCHYIYRATFDNLKPGLTYSYFVQNDDMTSETFNVTIPKAGNDWVSKFLVFGDMGRHGGGMVLAMLEEEVRTRDDITALIHFGDFAYDLKDDGGLNGDTFLNRIQPLATAIPYMTCVGNHEIEADLFGNYRKRFSMPRYDVDAGWGQMWHSWNVGQVHFISYSSEVYFANVWDIDVQYKWLEADLKAANAAANRTARPWIIAYGHRPMYCSNTDHDDCTVPGSRTRAGLEKLFHTYGVDVVFEAHEHSYERLWPVYNETVTQQNYVNPQAMVHIVTGAAGCNEDDGACLNPIAGPLGPWSAFRSSAEGTYVYNHLEVHNATHLYLDSYVAEEEAIEDSIWIVQEHHGMRS